MKHTCKNCHFLAKETAGNGNSPNHTFSLSNDERENIRIVKPYYSLKCGMGVWDEGVTGMIIEKREDVVYKTERNKKCFYWKYQNGMLFNAAIELQKREQENSKLKNSLRYTVIGLWISAISVFVSAFFEFLS